MREVKIPTISQTMKDHADRVKVLADLLDRAINAGDFALASDAVHGVERESTKLRMLMNREMYYHRRRQGIGPGRGDTE